MPTFSNDIAFRIVEEELKRPFGEVFELVEPEPVAGKFSEIILKSTYNVKSSIVFFTAVHFQ